MTNRIGQQLGNYRLTSQLGKGGFAEVYLGEHVHLKTQAAIKVLHQVQLSSDEEEKFRTEAYTIANLKHQHIIRVLDYGIQESTSTPFLVMDYAPRGTLRRRYRAGTILLPLHVLPHVKPIKEQNIVKLKIIFSGRWRFMKSISDYSTPQLFIFFVDWEMSLLLLRNMIARRSFSGMPSLFGRRWSSRSIH